MTRWAWNFEELSGEASGASRPARRQRRVSSVTAPPVAQPILLADVKAYLGVGGTAQDPVLTTCIKAACDVWEHRTGSALLDQEITTFWDGVWAWPYIPLPRPRISAITTVHWFDRANVATLLSASTYRLSGGRPIAPRLILNDDYLWPTDVRTQESMRVVQRSGWANAAAVPEEVLISLRQICGQLFDNRGSWEKDLEAMATLAWTPGVQMLSQAFMVVR